MVLDGVLNQELPEVGMEECHEMDTDSGARHSIAASTTS